MLSNGRHQATEGPRVGHTGYTVHAPTLNFQGYALSNMNLESAFAHLGMSQTPFQCLRVKALKTLRYESRENDSREKFDRKDCLPRAGALLGSACHETSLESGFL